jgi:16S rRNA processing protein RimM
LTKKNWKVSDIYGSEVFSVEGEKLGKLYDVLPSGSNDIWVVRSDPPQERELLIPALADVVRDVDVDHKKIIVALPPGLRDIFESH